MAKVLLVGKDWLPRAPLRAQLIEEGLDVAAQETVREALQGLESGGPLPTLLVVDLSSSDDPSADVDELENWSRRIPIWVIASRSLLVDKGLKGRGLELILFRPVDVGELVEQIKLRAQS